MTYSVWKKFIDALCILSSFIYAHSSAYRHLDARYKPWTPYIEICFLIDFCIHFVLSIPDPKDILGEPIRCHEKIMANYLKGTFWEYGIPLFPTCWIKMYR
jgi:hypothetical protein